MTICLKSITTGDLMRAHSHAHHNESRQYPIPWRSWCLCYQSKLLTHVKKKSWFYVIIRWPVNDCLIFNLLMLFCVVLQGRLIPQMSFLVKFQVKCWYLQGQLSWFIVTPWCCLSNVLHFKMAFGRKPNYSLLVLVVYTHYSGNEYFFLKTFQ